MNRSIVVILTIGLGFSAGIAAALITPDPPAKQTIEWLDNPRDLARFSLQGATGEFNNRSLLGHWTIAVFGFLHCPDVCPTSLSQLGTLAESLAKQAPEEQMRFLFVSVDPGRDSPGEVSRYTRQFHKSILGTTGTEQQLALLTDPLGIQFKISPDPNNYQVAHSITFSVIDPKGALRGRFRPGFDTEALINELRRHLESTSNITHRRNSV